MPTTMIRYLAALALTLSAITNAYADDQPVRLGARVQECAKCGMLHVVEVFPGYPANNLIRVSDNASFHMEADNDSITHINGKRVTSTGAFFRELNSAQGWTKLRIFDKQRDVTDDYWVKLDGNRPQPNPAPRVTYRPSQPVPQTIPQPLYRNSYQGYESRLRSAERLRESMERWVEDNNRVPLNASAP